jgi:hypothetical protein
MIGRDSGNFQMGQQCFKRWLALQTKSDAVHCFRLSECHASPRRRGFAAIGVDGISGPA